MLQWLATDRPRTPGLTSVLGVGWLGGAATAISFPGVPILTLLLFLVGATLVVGSRTGNGRGDLPGGAGVAATRLCLGLGTALTVTLSGFPAALAAPIYTGKGWVDTLSGLLLLGASVFLSCEVIGIHVGRSRGALGGRGVSWVSEILGLSVGLAVYHDLDPTFDAVFFKVGMIGPASHSPWTVAFFSVGLAGVYVPLALAVGSVARGMRMSMPGRSRVLIAITVLLGLTIAIMGFGLVTGTYHGFSRRMGFTP